MAVSGARLVEGALVSASLVARGEMAVARPAPSTIEFWRAAMELTPRALRMGAWERVSAPVPDWDRMEAAGFELERRIKLWKEEEAESLAFPRGERLREGRSEREERGFWLEGVSFIRGKRAICGPNGVIMENVLRRQFLMSAGVSSLAPAQAGRKRLIVHADDAGMCHSANVATWEAMEKGLVSSASVMLPCPWVQEFCQWARNHPQYDLGVHLTLTSEWRHFRWRPVASIDRVKGLIDGEGYMWRDVRSSASSATAGEVEVELRAQIERARLYGMVFSHLDSHMGTVFARPDYFEVYTKLAKEYGVPCMLPRPTPVAQAELKGYPITMEMLAAKQAAGFRMLDRLVTGVAGRNYAERRVSYRKLIETLEPGVTKLIIHLAKDDAEIRAISNSWEYRWADYQFWTSAEAKELLEQHQVELFTYRALAA